MTAQQKVTTALLVAKLQKEALELLIIQSAHLLWLQSRILLDLKTPDYQSKAYESTNPTNGYWPNETVEDREYRCMRLREFGARRYSMPYVRIRELVGSQRWIVGAYDKRIPWADLVAANYEPRNR